jgi:hypothetical protein
MHQEINGATQAANTQWDDAGVKTGALLLAESTSGSNANKGGTVLFGAGQGNFAYIHGGIDTTSGPGGSLYFGTRPDGGANILTRMKIDLDGDVGIGLIPTVKLHVDGAIVSGATTVTAEGPTDDVDVTGVNIVWIGSANVIIGGFSGGIADQIIHVLVAQDTDEATLEHNETGATQKIFLNAGVDQTFAGTYGGWILVCDGTGWFECGHA